MLYCGMSEEEARKVDPHLFNAIYELWLEDKKLQERLTARLCSLVHNFAQSFAKEPKFTNETDFMAIGKTAPTATFDEIVATIKAAAPKHTLHG